MNEINLLTTFGYLGIFSILFSETGLIFGIFLPGDTLLFSAGFLASTGHFNIWILVPLAFCAAVFGYALSYHIGKKYGPQIFKKPDSFFFSKSHITRSEAFFKAHGGKTVLFARFIPILRTIAPILAGIGGMNKKLFIIYNILGGLLWACGGILFGYFFGKYIPNIQKFILPVILFVMIASFAGSFVVYTYKKYRRPKLR